MSLKQPLHFVDWLTTGLNLSEGWDETTTTRTAVNSKLRRQTDGRFRRIELRECGHDGEIAWGVAGGPGCDQFEGLRLLGESGIFENFSEMMEISSSHNMQGKSSSSPKWTVGRYRPDMFYSWPDC